MPDAKAKAHASPQAMLSVRGLEVSYGGIRAVRGIDLKILSGEVVALIGANGAGKTTTLKAITGGLAVAAGEIECDGQSLDGMAAHQRVRLGMAMVPEGRRLFARMTVHENLMMGAFTRHDSSAVQADIEQMLQTFPRLRERLTQLAGTLSGGEQQMLAMARALMSRPKLLLLDEPSMGLSPLMVESIFEVIRSVSRTGTTILLVEQNAQLALQTAHRAYVMESGEITMHGDAPSLLIDPRVRRAYLGEDD
jgi:branched-chain amino acid transport system ATP-binding protein